MTTDKNPDDEPLPCGEEDTDDLNGDVSPQNSGGNGPPPPPPKKD